MRDTIQMPGNNGGANWGGAAVDPTKGRLFVVSKDLPAMLKLGARQGRARGRRALHQRLRLHDRERRTVADRAAWTTSPRTT